MNPIETAKSLMDLAGTPSALVTGTFLAFASRTINANIHHVNRARMAFGTAAAIAASLVMASLVALLAPLAYRSVFTYRGGIEAVLVVYWMIFLSAVGTLAYSGYIIALCIRELRRPDT